LAEPRQLTILGKCSHFWLKKAKGKLESLKFVYAKTGMQSLFRLPFDS